jgi:hypothetical protein
VYVDDTKVKKIIKTEEDVEDLQSELEKLNTWSENNNMEFNKKKFQVIRYGENEDLKNETSYFAGNYDEVIERFNSLRDLGVQLSDDGKFDEHIENTCNKSRKKCGWLLRTFYSRNTHFMKQMFKSLVQPHVDYCSVLWMPQEGCSMDKVEKVLRDFSRRIPELRGLNYWERLQRLQMNSLQRRLERYSLIYTWKVMSGLVPNPGLNWSPGVGRRGRMCQVPDLKGKSSVKNLRSQSYQVAGPQLWNCLPKSIRNKSCKSLEESRIP